jgi:hypothetical protein
LLAVVFKFWPLPAGLVVIASLAKRRTISVRLQ